MLKKFLGAVLVPLALAACSSSADVDKPDEPEKSGGSMSHDQALCSDLDKGRNLLQIKPGDMSPEDFAGHVYTATRNECPEYRDREDVATYLDRWGL